MYICIYVCVYIYIYTRIHVIFTFNHDFHLECRVGRCPLSTAKIYTYAPTI